MFKFHLQLRRNCRQLETIFSREDDTTLPFIPKGEKICWQKFWQKIQLNSNTKGYNNSINAAMRVSDSPMRVTVCLDRRMMKIMACVIMIASVFFCSVLVSTHRQSPSAPESTHGSPVNDQKLWKVVSPAPIDIAHLSWKSSVVY